MSKPIDQEREPFELAYSCAVENGWESTKELARYMWDQARAAVQPAGVAVPEGWKLVPAAVTGRIVLAMERNGVPDGTDAEMLWDAMLAAAPHPVSGEQKPERNETNDQIASVLLQHGTPSQQVEALAYAGITAPPPAQDVSGLVDALENSVKYLNSNDLNAIASRSILHREMRDALNDYRTQAQGGDQ